MTAYLQDTKKLIQTETADIQKLVDKIDKRYRILENSFLNKNERDI
jgi:hypothetical protein